MRKQGTNIYISSKLNAYIEQIWLKARSGSPHLKLLRICFRLSLRVSVLTNLYDAMMRSTGTMRFS